MRMAYLVMAHEDRVGLEHLLAALLPPGADDIAIVHVDAGSALWRELRGSALTHDSRVHLLPDPVRVIWGHWSQVEAARRLIARALELGCDYAHTLSGVDWPVASRDAILADIAQAPSGACFAEAIAQELEERMQQYRFDTRWLRLDPARDRLAYALTWELRRASRIIGSVNKALGRERDRPLGPWHKGSCWWSLPEAALRSTLADLDLLVESGRLKGTVCADEHAVPTSLARHHGPRLQPYRRFIDFPAGASSPRVLTRSDLPAIRASGAWFARKVDAQIDPFFRELP